MKYPQLLSLRLLNQQLSKQTFSEVEDVVSWMGAVQSQDFGAAVFALGERTKKSTQQSVEKAFNEGKILRTHVLRPTWHFITPVDIRWMLELTAPRVNLYCSHQYRKLNLDDAFFKKSNAAIKKVLKEHKELTREEIGTYLKNSKIWSGDLLQLTHIMLRAELDMIICSGSRKAKQFTYALFDEKVPAEILFKNDEALYELCKRYFFSHGPATLADFTWWSGLKITAARKALEILKPKLNSSLINEKEYWFANSKKVIKENSSVYLLTNYDEYTVAYADRDILFDHKHKSKLDSRGNILFNNVIIADGVVTGTWKKIQKKNSVTIEKTLFTSFSKDQLKELAKACVAYADFSGRSLTED